jgi:hypothetical protein
VQELNTHVSTALGADRLRELQGNAQAQDLDIQLGEWALMTVLLIAGASPARADHEINLFFNNFDASAVGTLPAPWQMVEDGKGKTDQEVVRLDHAVSRTQALKLVGKRGHWSKVQRKFKTDAPVVGTQYHIRFGKDSNPTGQPANEGETPGLFCMSAESYWGSFYGAVIFDHLTKKILMPTPEGYTALGDWTPDTWYKVRTLVDRISHRVKVWIDDGNPEWDNQIPGLLHPEWIDALGLVAGHAGGPVYYDNVRVFLPRVQDLAALAKEEIDRYLATPMPTGVRGEVGQLKDLLDEAMDYESIGIYDAAIDGLTEFLTKVEDLAKPRTVTEANKLPRLTMKEYEHLTRLGEQMIIQIQYDKNKS